jgi:predicted amidohydrolase
MGCDIIAFPEDTLGTLEWEAGHWSEATSFLKLTEREMLSRFGSVAASYGMYVICCNDCAEGDLVYNTAILIGRDGREIGRYRKIQLPIHEQSRARGQEFPVFDLPDIGGVGMCICYDIVFPETTRALALAGADIVFHLTLGGASLAGRDASLAAFRTRAAENFIYLVVAFRGGGSLIISPKGEVLTDGERRQDAIVCTEIDISAGRDAGDAHGGITTDFRARLFRERVPQAYSILTKTNPPILKKLRDVYVPSGEQASALAAEVFTTAADAFYEADRLLSEGSVEEAISQFRELSERYGTTWVGRASRERLEKIARRD